MRAKAIRGERLALLGVIAVASAFALCPDGRIEALSRCAGWLAMLPLALRGTRAFRPPRLPWAAVPLAHLPVAMIFAAGQIVVMLAVNKLAGVEAVSLIEAVRQNVVVYAALVVALLLVRPKPQK